jgi:Putative beta-barrel porin-2, OmpL-like. bbp2
MKLQLVLHGIRGVLLCCALSTGAQSQSAPAQAPAPSEPPAQTPAPPAAPAGQPVWSVGWIDLSGYIDGYYSYNVNRPSQTANGQTNDLYNFNDKTDQFNLSAAKLTLNHDPDPFGVHVDIIFGRTNALIHSTSDNSTVDYLEQAYVSAKPSSASWHGTEFDFGQFVTSAGAEVIEAKDDWNYSRSLLFSWAIPYYHFGLRSSVPVTKTWTAGLQLVNGWNDVNNNNGGVTFGLTSALTKPKYGWALNYYTGPQNFNTQQGYRNLIDTTITLTPTAKISAYLNYDYGQNRSAAQTIKGANGPVYLPEASPHWQGGAFALRGQVATKSALAGRFEYFSDNQGYQTGARQDVKEFTGTYEYKWLAGVLTRVEYRRDWSTVDYFHKGNSELVPAQTTLTASIIAFFGPKR